VTSAEPEHRGETMELGAEAIRVRAGFNVAPGELLAGGPVELEFYVESYGPAPLHLAIAGERATQRPGYFAFDATFEGASLADPKAAAGSLGGPATTVIVATGRPWRQALLLNQFLRLEDTPVRLAPGAAGRLDLACHRLLPLAATDNDAFASQGAPSVQVVLGLDLRRDDAALEALIARLFAAVMEGPPAEREPSLAQLLSLRSLSRSQIDALTRHPDPAVAGRARQA